MRRLFALLMIASVPAAASAQGLQTSGTISTGLQQVTNNTNSSKFMEYRDLRDNKFPLGFNVTAFGASGLFYDASATNVTRRDQSLSFSFGDVGAWRFDAAWDELPHNFSNKAATPYTSAGPGILEVGTTMIVPFKKLATSGADAPRVVAVDTVAAAYARQYSKPVDLETQTRTGAFQLNYSGLDMLDFSFGYTRRMKEGSKLGYGPIGDRPPRTLNIQLPEPIDYVTNDVTAAVEFEKSIFNVRAEYLHSTFENEIDKLSWRNVWASPAPGATYDVWDRTVATYGVRPLPADNTYQNAIVTAGVSLPFDSRFTASYSAGRMEQDEALVPYAYQMDIVANKTLPRTTAEALMKTTNITADYSIVPLERVNVRAFYRRFDLENEMPEAHFQYVTQDATNTNGTVSYVNKRVSLPIAYDRQNLGGEATLRLGFMRSSLGLGFEQEVIGRENRQVEESTENILRATFSARPFNSVSLRAKYLRGDRDAGEYNWQEASHTYWYPLTEANDNNNPQFTFEDHPDMRKFDMADRTRDQLKLTLGYTASDKLSISLDYSLRQDDYDSDVTAIQPLANSQAANADRTATTPGDQLGLLESKRTQYGIDMLYSPSDRLAVNISAGYDQGTAFQRGLEFNENNKANPGAINTATLGPWTRRGSQWTSDFDDRTTYAGLGLAYDVVPNKVSVSANYTLSLGEMDIVYGGFGVTNWDGTPFPVTHEFAFQTPAPVENNSHLADVSIDFPLMRGIGARLGWQYESYQLRDWSQSNATLQTEPVGTELFTRDTSRSFQWGNRLFNMGSYLAPGFTGHGLYFSLNYSFGGRPQAL